MAETLSIFNSHNEAIEKALALLGSGKPIAIPTETVYGLAADATNPEAITSIYETKGRPQFNPLICHMADLQMAQSHAEFSPLAIKLATAFWPGALTLVLPLKDTSHIHKLATAGLDSVGIRVPKGFSTELIAAFGKPLAAPSANRSGKISPTTAFHVVQELGDSIDLILDHGACTVGVESTILKIDGDDVYLLRPGGISAEEIETVIGRKLLRADAHSKIEAPGMLTSHYAPDANIRLNCTSIEVDEVLITFGDAKIENANLAKAAYNLSKTGSLKEAAQNLFDMLISADQMDAKAIAICPIPNHDLGEAINDRLTRAAAPREG